MRKSILSIGLIISLFVLINPAFAGRYYIPEIGRWATPDPLAEKYPQTSPYVYCANNPLRFIDPNGLEWYQVTEEYTDDDGNTQTRQVWQYYENTKEKEIWTGKYDKDGNKILENIKGIDELLLFNGSNLSWLQVDGSTSSWGAVSGVLDNLGRTQFWAQSVKDYGPIPEGWYSVDPQNTLAMSNASNVLDKLKWMLKYSAWGSYATPILSQSGTQEYAFGRNNAFIHGGTTPGSIGCIDLTSNNANFHKSFISHGRILPLNVAYPGLPQWLKNFIK